MIYFIQSGDGGPIKIGTTNNPAERIKQVEAWSPHPIKLLLTVEGGRAEEKALQDAFWRDHSHAEWFHASPRLLAAIAALKGGASIDDAIGPDKGRALRYLTMIQTRILNGTENHYPRVKAEDIALVKAMISKRRAKEGRAA